MTGLNDLVELTGERHGDWKVATDAIIDAVVDQHLLSVRVTEVGQATSSMPLFLHKVPDSGNWVIFGLASLQLQTNLFIENKRWMSPFIPKALQTYPFFLMNSPQDEQKFTVGIDEANSAFSTTEGEPLFESKDKASPLLSRITEMLRQSMQEDVITSQFGKKMEELGLVMPSNIIVQYEDETANQLEGLYTLDEKKLQGLDGDVLKELVAKGYMGPIYGLLMSVFQLNGLLYRNNLRSDFKKLLQVKIDTQGAAAKA